MSIKTSCIICCLISVAHNGQVDESSGSLGAKMDTNLPVHCWASELNTAYGLRTQHYDAWDIVHFPHYKGWSHIVQMVASGMGAILQSTMAAMMRHKLQLAMAQGELAAGWSTGPIYSLCTTQTSAFEAWLAVRSQDAESMKVEEAPPCHGCGLCLAIPFEHACTSTR